MITVRPAQPDEAGLVAELQRTGWREAYAHLLSPGFLAALPLRTEFFRGVIERGANLRVAELDGDVVGYALAGPAPEADPRDEQLWHLYQLSRAHGSGTGQALLDAVLGDRPAQLWTAEDNPRANAFYRRNGFLPDGERKVEDEWEGLVAIRMVR
jgi:ribosomal protein S18 acetylase RimI-like enzyme